MLPAFSKKTSALAGERRGVGGRKREREERCDVRGESTEHVRGKWLFLFSFGRLEFNW